jgi:hypothetical protein
MFFFCFRNVQSILNEKLVIDGHRIHALVDNIAKVILFSRNRLSIEIIS